MAQLSRSQLLVYAAIAVALLLVGARWIRSADASGPQAAPVREISGGGNGGGISLSDRHGELVVHVAGAVRKPGVYRLPGGSRVTDAVERAGGADSGAALDSVNLAAQLTDGQQVVVPAKAPRGAAGAATSTGEASGPISLGSATAEELETIEGIGPVTARSIVEFRAENGGVSSVDDLDQISGIGPATMEALRARLQP